MANTTWTPELASKMRAFKSALTRAKNKKDWPAVIKVADEFEAFFNDANMPLPDNWGLWERAKDDATFELRRASTTWPF